MVFMTTLMNALTILLSTVNPGFQKFSMVIESVIPKDHTNVPV